MACRWIKNNEKITGVLNQNGERSKLFDQLNEKYGISKAVEMYSVSESDDFQELFGGNQNKITTELVTEYLKSKLGQDISILSESELLTKIGENKALSINDKVHGFYDQNTKQTFLTEEFLSSKSLIHEMWHASKNGIKNSAKKDKTTGLLLKTMNNLVNETGFNEQEVIERYNNSNKNGLEVNPMIIGENGANNIQTYKDLLEQAKELDSKGVSLMEIEHRTKWYKTDGQWRMLSNEAVKDFTIKENAEKKINQKQNLKDVLQNNVILQMYPNLGELQVVFYDKTIQNNDSNIQEIGDNINGFNIPSNVLGTGNSLIYINVKGSNGLGATKQNITYTVAHELTHEIQKIENFPQGGTSKSMIDESLKIMDTFEESYLKIKTLIDSFDKSKLTSNEKLILEQGKIAVDFILQGNTKGLSNQYKHILGEIDAKLVEGALKFRDSQNINGLTYTQLFDFYTTHFGIDISKITKLRSGNKQFSQAYAPRQNETQEQYVERMREEVEANLLGENSVEYFNKIAEENKLTDKEKSSLINKVKVFIKKFSDWLSKQLGFKNLTPEQASKLTNKEVLDRVTTSILNGQFKEVDSNTLLRYITNQNKSQEQLTKEQIVDLQDFNSFDKDKLLNAFYDNNGIFSVNEDKLNRSKIYKPFEVSNIVRDIQLQATIKDSLERLKNTEIDEFLLEDIEQDRGVINEFNSFGKMVTINSSLAQKEENNDAIIMNDEEFFEYYNKEKDKSFKPVQTFVEVNGQIRQRKSTETELLLPITAKETENTKIKDLLSLRFDTLQENIEETRDVLNQIEDDLIKDSIDVIGLSEKPIDASLLNYLTVLNNFIKASTLSNSKVFADLSDEYFERDLSPKKEFIKGEQNKEYVKLETTLSEEEVYNHQGLIKLDDTTYIKTAKEDLEILYNNLRTYTEKYTGDLEKHVQEQLKDYNFKNAEVAEAIILYKMYFDAVSDATNEVVNDAEKQTAKFTGNYNYLTENYPSDFYSKFLAEKKLNSKLFRNFYSNFEINEKGIKLINTDEISLRNVKIYADENLKQYSLLSKQMIDLSDNSQSIENLRDNATNNPKTIETFTGQLSKVNQNEVIVKNNSQDFINIGGEIFESYAKEGSLNHFVKLESNNSDYYAVNVESSQSDINLKDYNYLNESPDKFTEYSKGEEVEDFKC